jgi:hypothetical protein
VLPVHRDGRDADSLPLTGGCVPGGAGVRRRGKACASPGSGWPHRAAVELLRPRHQGCGGGATAGGVQHPGGQVQPQNSPPSARGDAAPLSHFDRFLGIYTAFPEPGAPGGSVTWMPTRSVPASPNTLPHQNEDAAVERGRITQPGQSRLHRELPRGQTRRMTSRTTSGAMRRRRADPPATDSSVVCPLWHQRARSVRETREAAPCRSRSSWVMPLGPRLHDDVTGRRHWAPKLRDLCAPCRLTKWPG